jgi:hypothetical protein
MLLLLLLLKHNFKRSSTRVTMHLIHRHLTKEKLLGEGPDLGKRNGKIDFLRLVPRRPALRRLCK